MKRLSKEQLVRMNSVLELEAMGLRILTTALLNGVQPYLVRDVEFYSDEAQDYREVWSHYRPDSACGGVILIEQFEKETGRRVAHRTVLGSGEEFNALVNGAGGHARADSARACFRAQFDCVGAS